MSNRDPIITLLVVVALAAVLLLVNMTVQSETANQAGNAPAPGASTAPTFLSTQGITL